MLQFKLIGETEIWRGLNPKNGNNLGKPFKYSGTLVKDHMS